VRAAAASDTGDMRAALKAIDDARSINPAVAESWLAEIPIRIRSRQFAEASAAADQAIKIAPGSSEAFYQKASSQIRLVQRPALRNKEDLTKPKSRSKRSRRAEIWLSVKIRAFRLLSTTGNSLKTNIFIYFIFFNV